MLLLYRFITQKCHGCLHCWVRKGQLKSREKIKLKTFLIIHKALCHPSALFSTQCVGQCALELFMLLGNIRKVSDLQTSAIVRYTELLGTNCSCQEGAFEGSKWEELDLNESRGLGWQQEEFQESCVLGQLFSVCHHFGHRNLQNIVKVTGRGGQENHLLLCYKVVTRTEFAKGLYIQNV